MQNSLEKRMTSYFTLLTQMRVQGGSAYIEFVKSIFGESCTEKYKSDKYDLKIYLDFSKFEKDMYRKENRSRIIQNGCRICLAMDQLKRSNEKRHRNSRNQAQVESSDYDDFLSD